MRQLYTALLYLLLPLALLRLLWRSRKLPAYRQRWLERLGRVGAKLPASGGIWIHAVSVGEVQAAEGLVRYLQAEHADLALTITTTTPTGYQRVKRLFGDGVAHFYCPYDLPFALRGFLDGIKPALVILLETEIWPNMLTICHRRGIRVLLANARLSPQSAAGYARLGGFTRRTFELIDRLAVQSPDDARRFQALGVDPQRMQVTGSIKFDMHFPASVLEHIQVVRRTLGQGRSVWLAASTHEGEEELVMRAHRRVMQLLPEALLVLVPRHPERFEGVAGLCKRQGFLLARRSRNDPCGPAVQVYLGDTMGELPVLIGAADAVFMGGSLVDIGGHNMLEASALGVPVCFGPFVHNFSVISQLLVEQRAAVQISSAEELGEQVIAWLRDASLRSQIGENGRMVVRQNRGALRRLQAIVTESLDAL